MKPLQEKVSELLANADAWHGSYHRAETFGGPSLYFHQRALVTRGAPASREHLECVYATLASWGMHRMGRGGSKMRGFEVFRESVEALQQRITAAQAYTPEEIGGEAWANLRSMFAGIKIMASGTTLVGNSKVMHHMLPNIVPPIDREYTLHHLRGNTMFANDIDREWQMMRDMIEGFFMPLATHTEFRSKAERWVAEKRPWDTSVMKIVDNLLIGAKKAS